MSLGCVSLESLWGVSLRCVTGVCLRGVFGVREAPGGPGKATPRLILGTSIGKLAPISLVGLVPLRTTNREKRFTPTYAA